MSTQYTSLSGNNLQVDAPTERAHRDGAAVRLTINGPTGSVLTLNLRPFETLMAAADMVGAAGYDEIAADLREQAKGHSQAAEVGWFVRIPDKAGYAIPWRGRIAKIIAVSRTSGRSVTLELDSGERSPFNWPGELKRVEAVEKTVFEQVPAPEYTD